MWVHCWVGPANWHSSATLPFEMKEESLAVASITVGPLILGKDLTFSVMDAATPESNLIMPGACVACVTIYTSDLMSLENTPLISKEIWLVNTSNHSGPYYMGQNLVSDIMSTMSQTSKFNKGHGLQPPTLCLGQRPIQYPAIRILCGSKLVLQFSWTCNYKSKVSL